MANEISNSEPKISYREIAISDTGAGGGMLAPRSFGEVVAFADLMARSDIAIPKHLRNNAGACMAVTMQALRWELDPFAIANKSYFVSDRIAYEAQLIAAVVVTRAPIKRRPDYFFTGEGPTLRCRVSVEMLDGSVKEYESPPFAAITTKNSPLWKSDPQQQLGYFSIRSWARRHAPEVLLGVYTPDELAAERAYQAPPANRLAEKLASAAKGEDGFSHAFVASELAGQIEPIDGEFIDPAQETGAGAAPQAAAERADAGAPETSAEPTAAAQTQETDARLPSRASQAATGANDGVADPVAADNSRATRKMV
ncbi:recombinase RecT [Methylocystis sp. WRRC1]|uniref:recombinase RecT n=1 Tax=Methylocystis sp. WRRC1 TaxID=1732014 RepID=UPI001D13AA66|nr:recombinase RecT [Methylocystis sp. WRRC1]MCC3246726.1 recombinase RecT [Methylocystis sp. WRRC1]